MIDLQTIYLDPEPQRGAHDHVWHVTCRKDRYGLRVLECGCGARRRQAQTDDGVQDVFVQRQAGPFQDVLFDASSMQIPLALGGGA